MSGEAELAKDAATLRSSAIAVLAANGGLGATALSFAAATNSATWQAVGVQAVIAACALGFWWHGLRQGPAGRTAAHDGLFWILVVPVLLHAFGAGIALIAGIQRLGALAPAQTPDLADNLFAQAVLLSTVTLMAAALWSLGKKPRRTGASGLERAPWLALTLQTVAGLAGVLVATAAFMLWLRGSPESDAYGATLVGLVMAGVAARLSLEIRAALRATPERAADQGPILQEHASTTVLETKSIPPSSGASGSPAPEAKRPAAPAKPGQKPPVVARQSAKRKQR